MSINKKYLDFEVLQKQFNELKTELLIEENELKKLKSKGSLIHNAKYNNEKTNKANKKL